MTKFKTVLVLAAIAGGLALNATSAHATLLVDFSVNGGAFNQAYDGTGPYVISSTMTFNNAISVGDGGAQTNAPGSPAVAYTTAGTFTLDNISNVSQEITVLVAASPFTAPSNTGVLNASFSITDLTGPAGSTFTDVACAYSPAGAPGSCPPASGTYVETSPLSLTDTNGSNASPTATVSATSLTTPFELAEVLTATLVAGATIEINTAATMQVPEPASIALLGSGLLGLGLLRRYRRA